MSLVIGARTSALAQAQARIVAERLGSEATIRPIRTAGDATERPIPELGEGAFVTAIEDALRRGEIDVAVHSLKDLPTGDRAGLVLGAILAREDPRDVLITRDRGGLPTLPRGGTVGTSSPRRAAFLRALRPDAETREIRGNVDTRIRKVERGDYDGVILALAGLSRLGVRVAAAEVLDARDCPPAPGQGALAAQCRADDDATRALLAAVDDPETRRSVDAERALLRILGGSCEIPLGAWARVTNGVITLDAALASATGVARAHAHGSDVDEVAARAAAALGAVVGA